MKKLILLLLVIPSLSYGQGNTYTLNGVTLTQKRTASGIGYWEWGTSPNVVVFLHGIDQRGNGTTDMEKLLSEGPFGRNGWGTFTWKYPELFKRTDIKIITPQLPTSRSTWDAAYIDQFLDEVHFGEPLMLMGWSLGGGGALRYANQVNPKHKVTMVVGLASAINEKGTNIKIPYRLAHATNDGRVNVSQTDNFASGIPNYDASRYSRLTSGDHWGPLGLCDPVSGIYEEFKTLATPVVDVIGTLVKRGDKIYGVFNGELILIK